MQTPWRFSGDWIQGPSFDYGPSDSGYYETNPNPIFKRVFDLTNVKTTHLIMASLGYSLIRLNGQAVSKAELNSDWTNYAKRIYYDTYDVTPLLHPGRNELQVELGNGMYNPAPLLLFGKYNLRQRLKRVGDPRMILDLVQDDGQVLVKTDAKWFVHQGKLKTNNLYLGETVDFEAKPAAWQPATGFPQTDRDRSAFRPSRIPKITRHRIIKPKNLRDFDQGILIDFGEVVSGFFAVTISARSAQHVRFQYSELMQDERLIFETSYAGHVGTIPDVGGGPGAPVKAIQEDQVICQAGENQFENKFCYHSFRFVYVQGCQKEALTDIQATYVHTDLPMVGAIGTDNVILNQLYDAGVRTKLNNIHGIFEDCARERLEYGGDIVALADSNLYLFGLADFNNKIIDDFVMEQTPRGGISETAPYMGIQTQGTGPEEGPLLWQLVLPYLLYKQYQFYGDETLIRKNYPVVQKQVNYLLSIPWEQLAKRCIGDHGSVLVKDFRSATPDKLFVGYCTILAFVKLMITLATIVDEDATDYQQAETALITAIDTKFRNADGTYGAATQTGHAFALALHLGDAETLIKKLIERIDDDGGIFTTGIFGTSLLYTVLHRHRHDDVVYHWLMQDGPISFRHMLANENQVLAELFKGKYYSANHAMFSSYIQWFYQALGGIEVDTHAVGCSTILIQPYFASEVNEIHAQFKTVQGLVKTRWQRDHNRVTFQATIPEGIDYRYLGPSNGGKTILLKDEHGRIDACYDLEESNQEG